MKKSSRARLDDLHDWVWDSDDPKMGPCWKCKNCTVACHRPADDPPPDDALAGTMEYMLTCQEYQVYIIMES